MGIVRFSAWLIIGTCPIIFVLCLIGMVCWASGTGIPSERNIYIPVALRPSLVREYHMTLGLTVASLLLFVAAQIALRLLNSSGRLKIRVLDMTPEKEKKKDIWLPPPQHS